MDRMLYVAMTGAKHAMLAQTINNNNLANINTVGFRADLAMFRSTPISGPGYPSRTNAVVQETQVNMAAGAMIATGRDLDVALNEEGLIAVQGPNGNESYTRAGDLQINSGSLLVTGAGTPVLGNSGPIAIPPYEKLLIGADGTISIQPIGQAPNTLAVVDRIKLVSPKSSDMIKTAEGLLRTRSGEALAPSTAATLQSGFLESSNINGIEALTNMIELSRHYEAQIKVIKAAEENDAASAQLLRLG